MPLWTDAMLTIAIVMLTISQSVGIEQRDGTSRLDGKCTSAQCDPDYALKKLQADKGKKCADDVFPGYRCHNGYRYGCSRRRSICWKTAWNNATTRPTQAKAWYYWAHPDGTYDYCTWTSSCLKAWKRLEAKLPGDQPCKAYGKYGKKGKCQYGIQTWCQVISWKDNTKYCVHTRNRDYSKSDDEDRVWDITRPNGNRGYGGDYSSAVRCETDEDCDLTKIMKGDMREPKLEYNWELDMYDRTADEQIWRNLVAIPACLRSGKFSETACKNKHWISTDFGLKQKDEN